MVRGTDGTFVCLAGEGELKFPVFSYNAANFLLAYGGAGTTRAAFVDVIGRDGDRVYLLKSHRMSYAHKYSQ